MLKPAAMVRAEVMAECGRATEVRLSHVAAVAGGAKIAAKAATARRFCFDIRNSIWTRGVNLNGR
jgi:hypothetical protein